MGSPLLPTALAALQRHTTEHLKEHESTVNTAVLVCGSCRPTTRSVVGSSECGGDGGGRELDGAGGVGGHALGGGGEAGEAGAGVGGGGGVGVVLGARGLLMAEVTLRRKKAADVYEVRRRLSYTSSVRPHTLVA
jgi:hypothetical protein